MCASLLEQDSRHLVQTLEWLCVKWVCGTKIPRSSLTHYSVRIEVLKETTETLLPSSLLALAQQKAMGSLEMSELSLFWVSGIPAFETFVLRFHENGCFQIPWSLAVWAKRSLTAAHISISNKADAIVLKTRSSPV